MKMYQPSETVCKLVVFGFAEYIKQKIGEETGVVPNLDDIMEMYKRKGPFMRKTLAKEVKSLMTEMWEAGKEYGKEKNADCYIEFMTANKAFMPGIKKQFLERLDVPNANLTAAVERMGIELYDYLSKHPDEYHVKIEPDGTMYLNCSKDTFDPDELLWTNEDLG
jgi:hypothetical protein